MVCNLNTTNTTVPDGTTASIVLGSKQSDYKKNPQSNVILPCNILGDFLNPVFANVIVGSPINFAIAFFAQDELDSPGRFTPTAYAEALDAGFKSTSPELSEPDHLLAVAEAIYVVYGDTATALIKVAQGLVGLFGGIPLSDVDKIAIGIALVRLVLLKGIQGLGELGKALNEIGFTLDDIPLFLKDNALLVLIIGLEIFPLTMNNIAQLVMLLNNPILFPGFSAEERKKAILLLLWEDKPSGLGLKNDLNLFKDAFAVLNFVTADMIAEVMKKFLNATVLQTVIVLQAKLFSVNEITLTVFKLCSNASDTLNTKIALLIEIFTAMTNPAPSNDDIVAAILNITALFNDVNIFEVIVKVLNQLEPDKLTIATILKNQGQSALQITALLTLINVSPSDIAQILLMLNFDATTIAQSLASINVSTQTISTILSDLGIPPQDIAQALQGIQVSLQDIFNILVALNLQSNVIIDILRSLGTADVEIISLMQIVGTLAPSASNGDIGGTITPFDLALKVVINPEIGVFLGNDGAWFVNISGLGLANGLFVITLLTSGILLDTANLLVFDGIFIVFGGDDSIEEIIKALEEAGFTLEQKARILITLGKEFEEIKILLSLSDPTEIGQLLGLIISIDPSLDFEKILSELSAEVGPEAIGTIIGEALKIMQANGVIQLFDAEQIEDFIKLTKLDREDLSTALSVALKILCIPDVQEICIALKVDPCNRKDALLIQRDLAEFVLNDNVSFVYTLDTRKAAGSIMLHETIMSYDPQNLIDNKFCEDEFKYVVTNLKGQTGEATIKIQIIFEFSEVAYHL